MAVTTGGGCDLRATWTERTTGSLANTVLTFIGRSRLAKLKEVHGAEALSKVQGQAWCIPGGHRRPCPSLVGSLLSSTEDMLDNQQNTEPTWGGYDRKIMCTK